MEDVSVLWEAILYVCGGLVTVCGGVTAVIKLLGPVRAEREKRKIIEAKIEKHDELFEKDNKRLQSIEESQRLQCRAQMVLLQHVVTGDHIDKCQECYDEIEEFLLRK